METDLTDVEAAQALGKHRRTLQRWCTAGKLPGAYKAGRSWRIPRRALREKGLGEALISDDLEREVRAATLLCEAVRLELEGLKGQVRPVFGAPPVDGRNWPRIARELEGLEAGLSGLADLAGRVPRRAGQ